MEEELRRLAERIYLTPKKVTLKECESFIKEAECDINLLGEIDTSHAPIYYSPAGVSLGYDEISGAAPIQMEGEHIIKSLIKNYAISNIKKPS